MLPDLVQVVFRQKLACSLVPAKRSLSRLLFRGVLLARLSRGTYLQSFDNLKSLLPELRFLLAVFRNLDELQFLLDLGQSLPTMGEMGI